MRLHYLPLWTDDPIEPTDFGHAPALIEQLERTSRYRERRVEIAAWNEASPVIKRGLALTPVKFGISFTATHYNQAGALLHVYSDGTALLNYPVRAFDRALGEWRPLGSAKTNNLGRYRITYDAAQLKDRGKSRADLKLEVFDEPGDVLLASSPLIMQALPAPEKPLESHVKVG